MKEKCNQKYEDQIRKLADDRFDKKNYRVFDHNARIIKRVDIPGLVDQGKTAHPNCLVIVNGEGETIVITQEFERDLCEASKSWFDG